VLVSKVRLDQALRRSRSARVYVSNGTQTLSIDTSDVQARVTDLDSPWYALFEPAVDRQRVIVRRIADVGGTVTLEGMPEGPGVLAVAGSSAACFDRSSVGLVRSSAASSTSSAAWAPRSG
jgi:hypothetical protein